MAGWVTAEIAYNKATSCYEKYLRNSLDIIMNYIVKASEEGRFSTEVKCYEFIKGERTIIYEQRYNVCKKVNVRKEVDEFYDGNTLNERGNALLSVIINVLEKRGFSVKKFVIYPNTECILIKWEDVK